MFPRTPARHGERSAGNLWPDQALVVALSGCHMVTFLALAAKTGWPVACYANHTGVHPGKNPMGQMSVTRIDLHPVVRFDTALVVAHPGLTEMQYCAHRHCFIAIRLADSIDVTIT